LVDDATVEIENTHRNIEMGKPKLNAILDGAQQVAIPALSLRFRIPTDYRSFQFIDFDAVLKVRYVDWILILAL
jgi:hypothetical protein